ncbi:MAG TPA: PadR family transcriptional regulator [Candidatus Limnocylindrales bacterium]|nr:PadR family transcriptional regulator [Candidatus Limnocylindrales bacterium]
MPQKSLLNPTAASLLGFLHHGERTGWELAEVVEQSIGQFWNLTRSQVYRELRTLEELGYVDAGQEGARARRPYAINESGRRAFSEWISREPAPELIRFPLLLTMFFGDSLPRERLDRFLRAHRVRHESRLEEYRNLADGFGASQDFVALTARFGLFYEEAVMRWFDSLPSFAGDAGPRADKQKKKRSATKT